MMLFESVDGHVVGCSCCGAYMPLMCCQQALAHAESRSIVAEGELDANSIALQATVTLPGRSNLQARPSSVMCSCHLPPRHHTTAAAAIAKASLESAH